MQQSPLIFELDSALDGIALHRLVYLPQYAPTQPLLGVILLITIDHRFEHGLFGVIGFGWRGLFWYGASKRADTDELTSCIGIHYGDIARCAGIVHIQHSK